MTSTATRVEPDRLEGQRTAARLWVLHGLAWFALIAYCWTMWVLSGDFTPNTLGRGLEPTWYVVLVRCVEVFFGILMSGWILWRFVLGPKIRTGRFTFDGLFFLSAWLMFFQEPWINWTVYQFQYATTFVNFGGWMAHIPGWSSPNADKIPVPLVYGMAYLWMCGMLGYASSRYMARQRRRDPGRSVFRLITQTYALMIAIDIVMELTMTRLGLISYSMTIPSLTLFAGTDHQFPLYEPFSWAGTFVVLGCLHFFRDDRGRSLPERHIDKLRLGERARTFARFLAVLGVCQLAILGTFNIPYWLYALHTGPIPAAHIEREWRNGGVCGPQTTWKECRLVYR
ncbi:spirocyclase AveC family protein [Pseudonocardia eucalypti]|uniref:Spirocyclase AveC family protein n=1 Tax=Pseudonocardia eucalypti TaxID=648755 RepID=A0ABP9R354_9PSEU|nr:hypothetical protein [Pseudonocardia eucalypti]